MKKVFILLLLIIYILYSSTEKLNRKEKNPKSMDTLFNEADGHKYPGNIIESVHSNIPGDPQIKIHFAGTEEIDDDDDATISIDTEDEDEDDDVSIQKKKLSTSKTKDIHTFL